MKAVILAGGAGTRLWPYAEIRNKTMVPVANRPLAAWTVDAALSAGIEGVIIAAGPYSEQIANHFISHDKVEVVPIGSTKGAAFTLAAIKGRLSESFIVLNGDTLYEAADIRALADKLAAGPAVMLAKTKDGEQSGYICADASNGILTGIEGHPRWNMGRRIAAYGMTPGLWPYIENCSTIISDISVGMMPPLEGFLESTVADYLHAGGVIAALDAGSDCLDIDKPWHVMQANMYMVEKLCLAVTCDIIGAGSVVDPTAKIEGRLVLGKNCKVGRNVLIQGNIIVGDNTEIVDGAMILGNAIIGSDCSIRQYCCVGGRSVIGNRCVVGHCAEMAGVIFDTVYLYHYMEFWGILGRNTDLGAATVCGNLRFDNGEAIHIIKGRKEHPASYANCVYIGDFCRTGVNAILMPGVKTGVYSIVGPGVLLSKDLPNNRIIMAKQETTIQEWSSDRYGW